MLLLLLFICGGIILIQSCIIVDLDCQIKDKKEKKQRQREGEEILKKVLYEKD